MLTIKQNFSRKILNLFRCVITYLKTSQFTGWNFFTISFNSCSRSVLSRISIEISDIFSYIQKEILNKVLLNLFPTIRSTDIYRETESEKIFNKIPIYMFYCKELPFHNKVETIKYKKCFSVFRQNYFFITVFLTDHLDQLVGLYTTSNETGKFLRFSTACKMFLTHL